MRPDSLPPRLAVPIQYITREKAIEILREANENGKNKDSDNLDDFDYLRPGPFLVVWMPLTDLDYIAQNDDREEFYAAIPGLFPPVYGVFGPRMLTHEPWDGVRYRVDVLNGNHRCRAAEKRGERFIRLIIEEGHYQRFLSVCPMAA